MTGSLKFLGRGYAFSDENNSAFFVQDNELVLIDLPMSSFNKLRRVGIKALTGTDNADITVLVTHTHSDHVGGIAMAIHYAYYVLRRKITVIAPSDEVAEDLRYIFVNLEGCSPNGYELITAREAKRPWLLNVIPTLHAPELEGKCFGYTLSVGGTRVVYTGDTSVIEPFLFYLRPGTELYSDSAATGSPVHLGVYELIEKVSGLDIKLFLMHLDDPEAISEAAKNSGAELAPLFKE